MRALLGLKLRVRWNDKIPMHSYIHGAQAPAS